MCRAYVPLRFLLYGLGTTRSIRTVTTGTGGNMPFLSTNRNGTVAGCTRVLQYGLTSRYSIRLDPSTILENHSRCKVVVILFMSFISALSYRTRGCRLISLFANFRIFTKLSVPAAPQPDLPAGMAGWNCS